MYVRRWCAWHPKYYGRPLLLGRAKTDTPGDTHGMCRWCAAKVRAEHRARQEAARAAATAQAV